MLEWLTVADDRTGALEVAGEMVPWLGPLVVTVRTAPGGAPAAVVDIASRHLPPAVAAERAVAAASEPAHRRAHKIDSLLRGNWAHELLAVQRAAGDRVLLVPASPQLGRTCRGGVVHVDGVPVGAHDARRATASPTRRRAPRGRRRDRRRRARRRLGGRCLAAQRQVLRCVRRIELGGPRVDRRGVAGRGRCPLRRHSRQHRGRRRRHRRHHGRPPTVDARRRGPGRVRQPARDRPGPDRRPAQRIRGRRGRARVAAAGPAVGQLGRRRAGGRRARGGGSRARCRRDRSVSS